MSPSLRKLFTGSTILLITGGMGVMLLTMQHQEWLRGALVPSLKQEENMLMTFDADRNGVVTAQEYRKGIRTIQEGIQAQDMTYDINRDGTLSPADLITTLEWIRHVRQDECPTDPVKLKRGACGCFIPEQDDNQNGIMDCLDDTGRTEELIPPSGLFASVQSLSNDNAIIALTWNDNSWNEDGFIIERKIGDGEFRTLKEVTANSMSTINGNLTPNTDYTYRVRAKRGTLLSEPSKEMTVRTTPFYLDRKTVCQKWENREFVPVPDYYKTYQGIGDGRTNNYNSLRSARALVARSATGAVASDTNPIFLIFPEGNYLIDEYLFKTKNADGSSKISNIQWMNLSYVRLLGCGKVVVSTSGKYARSFSPLTDQAKSEDGLQIFRFMNGNQIAIEGMELNGNVQHASNVPENHDGNSAGLTFYGTTNYLVRDMNIHHFGADGIYIGGGGVPPNYPNPEPANPSDRPARIADKSVRIHNVRMANNGRQAMTIVQARDVWISNSQFLDTGRSGSVNYAPLGPSAGIDIEPNYFNLARDSTNNRETGSYDSKKIDVLTGDIVIENSTIRGNYGPQIAAVLGRPINPYLKSDGTCCDSLCANTCSPNAFTIWPNPRVENVTIRHSYIESAEYSSKDILDLGIRNGVLEHSLVNGMANDGKIFVTFHGGASTGANGNDTLITTIIRKNTLLSNGEILYGHWARHPIEISQNLIRGTAALFTAELVPEAMGEKKISNNFWTIPLPDDASFSPLSSGVWTSLMRLFANTFEGNTYCFTEKQSESFGCQGFSTEDLQKGYAILNFGTPRVRQNEQYRSGCLLRPHSNVTECTAEAYTIP